MTETVAKYNELSTKCIITNFSQRIFSTTCDVLKTFKYIFWRKNDGFKRFFAASTNVRNHMIDFSPNE